MPRKSTFVEFSARPRKEQRALIEQFQRLFCGRPDVYAIRVDYGDRAAYIPSHHEAVVETVERLRSTELTEAVLHEHLSGGVLIGVYPIWDDSTVQFFALDFDAKSPDDPDPYKQAIEQAEVLWESAGLPVYVERSQSGKGYHVWGFLDGPVNAGQLRHALKPFLLQEASFDRMFPNQDGVTPLRPLGNLIALPLHGARLKKGNSAFVYRAHDQLPEPYEDQFAFLATITTIPAARILELFEDAGEYVAPEEHAPRAVPPEALKNSWKMTDPTFGCEFVRWAYENPYEVDEPLWHALACNFAQLADGRELFHEWSRQDEDRYDKRAVDRKFDQALEQNKPHGCEAIRALGGNCRCDERFPGRVYHPFDLVKLPFSLLLNAVDINSTDSTVQLAEGLDDVFTWLEEVQRDPTLGQGLPTGLPTVDEMFGFRDGELTILAARNSIGKAQPLDAKVLTPNGFVRMGDLRLDDLVIGSDGKPTKVMGIFPQGALDIYRVTFSDGSSTECCDEHLWYTWTVKDDRLRREGSVKSLSHIRKKLTVPVHGGTRTRFNHRIPTGGVVEFAPRPPLQLAEVYAAGMREGGSRLDPQSGASVTEDVLMGAPRERLAFLQGLLDAGGSVRHTAVRFETSSTRLRDVVCFLGRSLGGTVHETRHGELYRLRVHLPAGMRPVRSSRRREQLRESRYASRRTITAVEYVGKKEAQCIAVEAPDHLYVTDDFLVTHNTALAMQWALHLAGHLDARTKLFSLEMTRRQVLTRAAAHLADVSQTDMRKGKLTEEDWARLREAKQTFKSIPFFVNDRIEHLDPMLESIARFAMEAPDKRTVVFIDYLQIIPRNGREDEQNAITRCVNSLKRLAKAMPNLHVVLLCQLNRGADDTSGEDKVLDSWLRGSGTIEQVADNIFMIIGEKGPGIVERWLHLHKQRNGDAGLKFGLDFNQPVMRWAPEGTWALTAAAAGPDGDASRPRVEEDEDEEEGAARSSGGRRSRKDFMAGL